MTRPTLFLLISVFLSLDCNSSSTGSKSSSTMDAGFQQKLLAKAPDEYIEAPNNADSSDVIPVDFAPCDTDPIATRKIDPIYSRQALNSGSHGALYIKAWLTKRGTIRLAVVLSSKNRMFNRGALEAIVQWQFLPAAYNGKPIDIWLAVPFRF